MSSPTVPKIIIEDYNPQWPTLYEQEKAAILEALGNLVIAIEHVGSTSVPGLGAKPIVDVMPAVRGLEDLDKCVEPLQRLGYTYHPRYEADMPFRRHFTKKPPEHPYSYNVHVVPYGNDFWVRHLLFRDYLRAHPETAREYERFKREIAPRFTNSNDYSDAKTPYIRRIEDMAFAEQESLSNKLC